MSAHIEPVPRLAFSINEAALSTSLSRRKLYELIDAGQLPTVKVGKRRLITRQALERFFIGQEHAAA